MNKESRALLSCLILGMFILLSACSDKQDTSTQKIAAVDQLTPKYQNSLEQGIDFRKPGYPSFLIDVTGVSNREDWGRWTDANIAPVIKFRFKQTLPKKFIIELQANAIGPNVGHPIKIRAGSIDQNVTLKNWPDSTTYQLGFEGVIDIDVLEIFPLGFYSPKDSDRNSADVRKLGLGLIALKIRPVD